MADYASKAANELRETARRKGFRGTDSTSGRFHPDRYTDDSLEPIEKTYKDGTVVVVEVKVYRPLDR